MLCQNWTSIKCLNIHSLFQATTAQAWLPLICALVPRLLAKGEPNAARVALMRGAEKILLCLKSQQGLLGPLGWPVVDVLPNVPVCRRILE